MPAQPPHDLLAMHLARMYISASNTASVPPKDLVPYIRRLQENDKLNRLESTITPARVRLQSREIWVHPLACLDECTAGWWVRQYPLMSAILILACSVVASILLAFARF